MSRTTCTCATCAIAAEHLDLPTLTLTQLRSLRNALIEAELVLLAQMGVLEGDPFLPMDSTQGHHLPHQNGAVSMRLHAVDEVADDWGLDSRFEFEFPSVQLTRSKHADLETLTSQLALNHLLTQRATSELIERYRAKPQLAVSAINA